jgi:CRP/FNR family transcriptional regulator, anaerobic regulatory protein
MYISLNNLINSTIEYTTESIIYADSLFEYSKCPKNTILLNYGDIETKLYFINKGYLRCFFSINDDDITISISSPCEFSTSILSFFNNEKSKMTIQCITDCELLSISKDNLEKLYTSHPVWHEFGRKIMENALIEKEDRLMDQLHLTAEQRYLKLLKLNPGLIQNCPVKYIASFLGVHSESLSRIRGSIS